MQSYLDASAHLILEVTGPATQIDPGERMYELTGTRTREKILMAEAGKIPLFSCREPYCFGSLTQFQFSHQMDQSYN